MRFMAALLLALAALCASAQEARTALDRQAASIEAQRLSVADRQRASAERQRAAITTRLKPTAGVEPFYIVAFPDLPPPPAIEPACEPVQPDQISQMVERISKREGLTANLLRAVIEKESAYLPCAVSARGAAGLMQLMPETADGLGVTDPFDPAQNLNAGAKFLKQMLTKYGGDIGMALAAYNAGPSRVDRASGIPQIPETVDYVSDILRQLNSPAAVEPIR